MNTIRGMHNGNTKAEIKKAYDEAEKDEVEVQRLIDTFKAKMAKTSPGHDLVIAGRPFTLDDLNDLKLHLKQIKRERKELFRLYGRAKRRNSGASRVGGSKSVHTPVVVSQSLLDFFADPTFNGFSQIFNSGYMERGTINQLFHFYFKAKGLADPDNKSFIRYDAHLKRFMDSPAGFVSLGDGRYAVNTSGASTAQLIAQKERTLGKEAKIGDNGFYQVHVFSLTYLNSVDAEHAAQLGLTAEAQNLNRADVKSESARDYIEAERRNKSLGGGQKVKRTLTRTSLPRTASVRRSASRATLPTTLSPKPLSPLRTMDLANTVAPLSPPLGQVRSPRGARPLSLFQ